MCWCCVGLLASVDCVGAEALAVFGALEQILNKSWTELMSAGGLWACFMFVFIRKELTQRDTEHADARRVRECIFALALRDSSNVQPEYALMKIKLLGKFVGKYHNSYTSSNESYFQTTFTTTDTNWQHSGAHWTSL